MEEARARMAPFELGDIFSMRVLGMGYFCHACGHELSGPKVFRRDECEKCSADLHVCLNCREYDRNSSNQCREPQAELVSNKDRSNFCDYFAFADSDHPDAKVEDKQKILDALDDLFN
jgi:ribosome-binding protein aMBF1 (putative translation factor)